MVRRRTELDGPWEFAFEADSAPDGSWRHLTTWRTATVPQPWQAEFDDLRNASGTGWYRRTFTGPTEEQGALILHFGAVDYHATVWVNDHLVGEHQGGYLPFEFDIAALVTPGTNELVVRAVDSGADSTRWPDYPFGEVPHGKQSWYGPIGGIWQSVWLEERATHHIRAIRLTPQLADGSIDMKLQFNGPLPPGATTLISVRDPQGTQVAEATMVATTGQISLPPTAVQPWSPETPALYTVTATLQLNGDAVDDVDAQCGFRTVEARDGRIYLNGEPIYLRGVLDQGYYPETIYTPPSLEFLEDQARKAKALGLNCLRIHIKIEDPRYYEVADRLGLLVWTEIPNWVQLSPQADERIKTTFRDMVARDWNHPSIIAWTLVNENWGTDLARNPAHRQWLAEFTAEAKAIDPTRLVVDNSACCDNFHVAGDLEDFHHYRCIPDHAAQWDEWVADFASRARWAWAEDYDANRRADLPLLVSEFGNWGLPDPATIQEKGRDPWWFETGHNWGNGIVYPHNMAGRFSDWQLGSVFGDLASFARAHQEHMARSLQYEISSMRLEPAIGGYVITEFTDVHWECNGLLDMQRGIKAGLDRYFISLNQDRVVVVRPHQWSGRPGSAIAVDLATFDPAGVGAAGAIHWQLAGASGELPAPGGTVTVPLPDGGSAIWQLELTWRAGDGTLLATNAVELAAVTTIQPAVTVCCVDDPALALVMAAQGYQLTVAPADAQVLVTRSYSADVQGLLQSGAKVLVLADAAFPTQDNLPLPVVSVMPREGSPWQGDWATSFSWLRKEGPFAQLPGGPLLEMEYASVAPKAVLHGVPTWGAEAAMWAGMALGWIHAVAAVVAKTPYGQGQIVTTTFDLHAINVETDAVAQSLLAGLIQLTADASTNSM